MPMSVVPMMTMVAMMVVVVMEHLLHKADSRYFASEHVSSIRNRCRLSR